MAGAPQDATARAIRQILDAELEAQKTIESAAHRRADFNAEARRQGEAELQQYQAQLQGSYEEKAAQQKQGSSTDDSAELQRSLDKIAIIERTKESNQKLVIDSLLSKVLTVKVPTRSEKAAHGTIAYNTLHQH
eukprot:TRINITY_DN49952_c0_g1_i1.p1 TRINITY_DN49952_c0_g1~~TRINITY_DN49952_c0_g1_i1.p1  ORF type:complete len:134 (+),score=58.08 TRINITY_DN49952_c0_g1_i1:100-501(+)